VWRFVKPSLDRFPPLYKCGNDSNVGASFCILMFLILLTACSSQTPIPDPSKPQRVAFHLQYHFHGKHIKQLQVFAILPPSIVRQQQILSREYSLYPNTTALQNGDSIGVFFFLEPLGDSVLLDISGTALLTPPADHGTTAERLQLEKIQGEVSEHLRYSEQTRDISLDSALKNGTGDCTEFAALGVRLCQQHGFASHAVSGMHWRQNMSPFHSWTACTVKDGAEVLLDPTWVADPLPNGKSLEDSLTTMGLQRLRTLQGTSWHFVVSTHDDAMGASRWVSYRYAADAMRMEVTGSLELLGE